MGSSACLTAAAKTWASNADYEAQRGPEGYRRFLERRIGTGARKRPTEARWDGGEIECVALGGRGRLMYASGPGGEAARKREAPPQ